MSETRSWNIEVLGPSSGSSLGIDSCGHDWMIRPWCVVIEQKVQPPKQPPMIVTESFTVSNAGISWSP